MLEPARIPTEIHKRLVTGFLANNLDGLVGLYEQDAVWMPGPGEKPIRGLPAIREAFARLQSFKITAGTMGPTMCMERDGLALTSCKWQFKAIAPDGTEIEFRGRGVELMRQQADGTWLHHIDNPWNEVELRQPDGNWVAVKESPWSASALAQGKVAEASDVVPTPATQ